MLRPGDQNFQSPDQHNFQSQDYHKHKVLFKTSMTSSIEKQTGTIEKMRQHCATPVSSLLFSRTPLSCIYYSGGFIITFKKIMLQMNKRKDH